MTAKQFKQLDAEIQELRQEQLELQHLGMKFEFYRKAKARSDLKWLRKELNLPPSPKRKSRT